MTSLPVALLFPVSPSPRLPELCCRSPLCHIAALILVIEEYYRSRSLVEPPDRHCCGFEGVLPRALLNTASRRGNYDISEIRCQHACREGPLIADISLPRRAGQDPLPLCRGETLLECHRLAAVALTELCPCCERRSLPLSRRNINKTRTCNREAFSYSAALPRCCTLLRLGAFAHRCCKRSEQESARRHPVGSVILACLECRCCSPPSSPPPHCRTLAAVPPTSLASPHRALL